MLKVFNFRLANEAQKTILIIVASCLFLALYFTGILRPDFFVFLGGAEFDEKNYHLPAIINFASSTLKNGINEYENYGSATFPLYHILFSILYKISQGNILFLRFVGASIAILTAYLLFIYINRHFNYKNKISALCVSIAFLLSPTIFSTSTFLGTDTLPFLFLVLTALGIQKIKENSQNHSSCSISLVSISSFLAFYTRQFYFWLPIVPFFYIIRKQDNLYKSLFIVVIYTLLLIPVLYIFFLWGGLTPPSLQDWHLSNQNSLSSIVYPLAILSIYALPLYVLKFSKLGLRGLNLSLQSKKNRREFLVIFTVSLIFLILIHFQFEFYNSTAGMIQDLSSLGSASYYLLIFLAWIGVLIIFDWLKHDFAANVFWVPLICQFIITTVIYLRYIDPLLWILMFVFTKSPDINRFYQSRFMIYFPLISLGFWLIKAI